jgi:hypothetical protein
MHEVGMEYGINKLQDSVDTVRNKLEALEELTSFGEYRAGGEHVTGRHRLPLVLLFKRDERKRSIAQLKTYLLSQGIPRPNYSYIPTHLPWMISVQVSLRLGPRRFADMRFVNLCIIEEFRT